MTPPDPIFLPSPERALLLLDQLLDPDLSLRQLARHHNTSVPALSLYLSSTRAADLLAPLHSALSTRIHLIAAEHLPAAIASLSKILHQFNHAPPDLELTPEERTRARLHALRAAALLTRLSTHRPRPAPAAHGASMAIPIAPSPRAPIVPTAPTSSQPAHPLQPSFQPQQAPTPAMGKPLAAASESRGFSQATSASVEPASESHDPSPAPHAPAASPLAASRTPTPATNSTPAPSNSPSTPPLPSDPAIALARAHLRTHYPAFSDEELEQILAEALETLPADPELALISTG